MAGKTLKLGWYDGNQIDLLQNGGEFFPALCQAIDEAQASVHLETYIFNLDQTGERVLEHLAQACRRSVKVRVVLDGFGSALHIVEICQRLAEMGAQYRVYRPEPQGLGHFKFSLQRLRRLHRKVAVIDGRLAFVGGINIIDDLEDVPNDGIETRPRFDFAVRLQGPIVVDVERTQSRLWLRMAWRRRDDWAGFYQRLKVWSRRRTRAMAQRAPRFEPGMRAALLLRDNIRFRQTIENAYIDAIGRAKRDILLANAYFFPGRRLRLALEHAAARGVRVRLLLQGRSEYPMQYRACRYMYCKVLDDGIEIYEYMASYLHAKVAVIDGSAMVGSSNIDPFSLLLAREANVFIQDDGFASELKTALEVEIDRNAARVTEESLQRRGFIGRYFDAVSYILLRIGVALTGKSSQY
jgi:cardiolipin synthase